MIAMPNADGIKSVENHRQQMGFRYEMKPVDFHRLFTAILVQQETIDKIEMASFELMAWS